MDDGGKVTSKINSIGSRKIKNNKQTKTTTTSLQRTTLFANFFFGLHCTTTTSIISCEINDGNERGRIFSFVKQNALSHVRVKILKRIPQIIQKEIKKAFRRKLKGTLLNILQTEDSYIDEDTSNSLALFFLNPQGRIVFVYYKIYINIMSKFGIYSAWVK